MYIDSGVPYIRTRDWKLARISHTHGRRKGQIRRNVVTDGRESAYSRWRHGGDGLERRPPAGIARERETREDDVSSGQRECRAIFVPGGVCGGPDHGRFSGGSRHGGPQGRRRFLAVRLYWVSVRGPQRCERCLPLAGTDHAERRDSRREGTTSERGSFPSPAFGGLCRPEAGVPSRPRRRGGRRSAFPGGLCRPEAGVPSRPRRRAGRRSASPGGRRHHDGWRTRETCSLMATGGRSVSPIRHPVTSLSARASRVTGIPVHRLRFPGVRCGP